MQSSRLLYQLALRAQQGSLVQRRGFASAADEAKVAALRQLLVDTLGLVGGRTCEEEGASAGLWGLAAQAEAAMLELDATIERLEPFRKEDGGVHGCASS